MTKNRFALLVLSLALSGAPAFAAVPYLVEDIDPRFVSDGSSPHGFESLGGRVIFSAGPGSLWATAGVPGDPVELTSTTSRLLSGPATAGGRAFFTTCGQGCGLWASDGTPGGTARLVRFQSAGSSTLFAARPEGLPRTLVIANGGAGPVLWATDGTRAGTKKVGTAAREARGLVGFGGKGWFVGDLPNAVGALFSTDGRPGGTRRIGTTTHVSRLTPLGARLLFFSGQDLWTTDGTAQGTSRLAVLPGAGNYSPESILAAGSLAFFFRFNGNARELWTTDGTASGTRQLISTQDLETDLVTLGGRVAFLASDATGRELWSSDGTAAGTRRVKDVCAGTCAGTWRLGVSALGRVWFTGFTNGRGLELWTSDLSAAGTRLLRDLCPGSCSSDPRGWFASGNRVYFVTDVPGGESLLYVSDGTGAGTRAVASSPVFLDRMSAATLSGGSIVFAGRDPAHGVEPWVSDATPAGTRRLADLEQENLLGSNPVRFSAAGGRAFFYADDGIHGSALWSSDGTSEGTRLVYDDLDSAGVDEFLAHEIGGRLVLMTNRFRLDPFELLGSDGTPEETEKLLPAGVTADRRRVQAAGRLFFVAQDAGHGAELWATDGTNAGTRRLSDFVPPGPFRETPGVPILFALGDRAVAPVLSPLGGEELWISDGTEAGTRPLEEVYPFLYAPLAAAKSPVAALSGRHWFVADSPGDGAATLWRTDLSAGGTAPVASLDLSTPGSAGWKLFPFGSRMLVFGPSSSLGRALWVSDGTAAGTHVIGAAPFPGAVPPIEFAGRLWFVDDGIGTLWTTDGTAAGTARVVDSNGQFLGAAAFSVVGGKLAILTREGPYESDGTVAGTVRIELPGEPDFSFFEGVGAAGRLFFRWNDLLHGPELWALRP